MSDIADPEKHGHASSPIVDGNDVGVVETDQGQLHRNLKGRHMQMIAM
jgi:amino acid permease